MGTYSHIRLRLQQRSAHIRETLIRRAMQRVPAATIHRSPKRTTERLGRDQPPSRVVGMQVVPRTKQCLKKVQNHPNARPGLKSEMIKARLRICEMCLNLFIQLFQISFQCQEVQLVACPGLQRRSPGARLAPPPQGSWGCNGADNVRGKCGRQ